MCSKPPPTAEREPNDERAFRKLQLAAHWADLHPATADTGVETFGGAALLADESLGGDGTPAVAAFTPEPFALGVGHVPVRRGTADRRRPRPPPPPPPPLETRWSRLEVPAWQARRVARQTHRLSKAAAIWVDEQLADRSTCGPVVVDRLVAQAIATYDPENHEDREDDAQAGWDVTLTHPEATDFLGTSHLEATGDTLVLKEFYDQVCAVAHQLFLDGDTSPSGRPQGQGHRHPHRPTHRLPAKSKVKVYARVDARDLEPDALAAGEIEKLGAATLTKIRDLGRPPPGGHPTGAEHGPTRRGRLPRPTRWMRDLVVLRDGHCIFPRCQVDARSCDLDHTIPYDENGPPGQTTAGQSRRPVPATPPRQDHRSLAIPPHARRRLPLARPLRHEYLVTPSSRPRGCAPSGHLQ